uniref:Uncharacterized protein n=1 Tax=Anguilla anguilla TaxID=7936 RepID=A0A0E9TCV4_ANGAN
MPQDILRETLEKKGASSWDLKYVTFR